MRHARPGTDSEQFLYWTSNWDVRTVEAENGRHFLQLRHDLCGQPRRIVMVKSWQCSEHEN